MIFNPDRVSPAQDVKNINLKTLIEKTKNTNLYLDNLSIVKTLTSGT